MDATSMVTQQVESYGALMFSAKEMAFYILDLMHSLLFSITRVEPIWVDLNGGMGLFLTLSRSLRTLVLL